MTNAEQPMDHVPDDGVAREQASDIQKNVKSKNTWIRLFFMLVMGIAWSLAGFVTSVVVIANFLVLLLTGGTNDKLTSLGHSMATYLFQIIDYMTMNTEERPFPFDLDWPDGQANSNETKS
jgi:hypothetical protein